MQPRSILSLSLSLSLSLNMLHVSTALSSYLTTLTLQHFGIPVPGPVTTHAPGQALTQLQQEEQASWEQRVRGKHRHHKKPTLTLSHSLSPADGFSLNLPPPSSVTPPLLSPSEQGAANGQGAPNGQSYNNPSFRGPPVVTTMMPFNKHQHNSLSKHDRSLSSLSLSSPSPPNSSCQQQHRVYGSLPPRDELQAGMCCVTIHYASTQHTHTHTHTDRHTHMHTPRTCR